MSEAEILRTAANDWLESTAPRPIDWQSSFLLYENALVVRVEFDDGSVRRKQFPCPHGVFGETPIDFVRDMARHRYEEYVA